MTSRDYTIIPEDAEVNWLSEFLFHDSTDRRYMLLDRETQG